MLISCQPQKPPDSKSHGPQVFSSEPSLQSVLKSQTFVLLIHVLSPHLKHIIDVRVLVNIAGACGDSQPFPGVVLVESPFPGVVLVESPFPCVVLVESPFSRVVLVESLFPRVVLVESPFS